jgi:hypothetical protein
MSSKLRPRARERLRRRAKFATEAIPTRFLIEEVARRFDISTGRLEVRLRDGFLVGTQVSRKLNLESLEGPIDWSVLADQAHEKEEAPARQTG